MSTISGSLIARWSQAPPLIRALMLLLIVKIHPIIRNRTKVTNLLNSGFPTIIWKSPKPYQYTRQRRKERYPSARMLIQVSRKANLQDLQPRTNLRPTKRHPIEDSGQCKPLDKHLAGQIMRRWGWRHRAVTTRTYRDKITSRTTVSMKVANNC